MPVLPTYRRPKTLRVSTVSYVVYRVLFALRRDPCVLPLRGRPLVDSRWFRPLFRLMLYVVCLNMGGVPIVGDTRPQEFVGGHVLIFVSQRYAVQDAVRRHHACIWRFSLFICEAVRRAAICNVSL